jgi:hypothetical protein
MEENVVLLIFCNNFHWIFVILGVTVLSQTTLSLTGIVHDPDACGTIYFKKSSL